MIEILFATLMAQAEIKPLQAEFYCTTFEILDRTLRKEYKEEPMVLGRSVQDKVTMAIYSNASNESFTVIVVYSDRACVLGAGDHLMIRTHTKPY
jgi:hypothetical protein